MADKKKKDERVRNWTFIVYPDSAPRDWLNILQESHIPFCVSPLHDKDVNPDGTLKKPHWHVLLKFPNKMSYKQVLSLTRMLNSPNPQKCNNLVGMVRYFSHKDNPEKYQYNQQDTKGYCGFDVNKYLLTDAEKAEERYQCIGEMTQFIDENNIYEFQDLLMYARDNRFDDWFKLLCDNSAYIIGQYIKSKRNRMKEG